MKFVSYFLVDDFRIQKIEEPLVSVLRRLMKVACSEIVVVDVVLLTLTQKSNSHFSRTIIAKSRRTVAVRMILIDVHPTGELS